MDMVQFTDLSWETEEELLASLKKFFALLQTDLGSRKVFHDVYRVCNETQLSMKFEDFYRQFDHLEPPTVFKKNVYTVMYFGDENLRYRFISGGGSADKDKCFIRKEKRSKIVTDYYEKTTCECSMRLFVKAMILLEKIGRHYFVIREAHLELTNEDVEYRIHHMVSDAENGATPKEMILLWADSPDPKYLNARKGLFYTYFTCKYFTDMNVTMDHLYSEWGFWKKINGIADEESKNLKIETTISRNSEESMSVSIYQPRGN